MEQPDHESRRIDPRRVRSAAVGIVRRAAQRSSQRGARKQRAGGGQAGWKSGGGWAQVAGPKQTPDFAEKNGAPDWITRRFAPRPFGVALKGDRRRSAASSNPLFSWVQAGAAEHKKWRARLDSNQ